LSRLRQRHRLHGTDKSAVDLAHHLPHCRERLKYLYVRNFNIVLVAISILIGFPAGFFFVYFVYDDRIYLSFLILLAVLLIWLPIELVLGRYLRANKQLARRE